jgi:hypothetical protein
MAKYSERNATLREFAISPTELKHLGLVKDEGQIDYEEALWRMQHEERVMLQWVKDRYAWLHKELDKNRPAMPPTPKPIYDGPPIVSHRVGRGPRATGQQHYGEKFG